MFDAKKTKDALVRWIRDYFCENGNGCPAVIGISGGKDSSIVAALCVAALGADRVLGVMLPCGQQSDIDVSRALCAALGIEHVEINIAETVQSIMDGIAQAGIEVNDVAAINVPARMRLAAVYAVCNAVGGRVACTGNLSEDYVGYATKFGIGSSGDFSPLSELTVTEVKAVGRALGLAPKFVDKVPADGLCGKTDEDSLGFTYDALDRYIREGICPDPAVKEKIDRRHQANRHKLEPVPKWRNGGNFAVK